MTVRIPCGRFHRHGRTLAICREATLCPGCVTIRQLTAACLSAAATLEWMSHAPVLAAWQPEINRLIGRLRADAARCGSGVPS